MHTHWSKMGCSLNLFCTKNRTYLPVVWQSSTYVAVLSQLEVCSNVSSLLQRFINAPSSVWNVHPSILQHDLWWPLLPWSVTHQHEINKSWPPGWCYPSGQWPLVFISLTDFYEGTLGSHLLTVQVNGQYKLIHIFIHTCT